jgi:hypothetical protein
MKGKVKVTILEPTEVTSEEGKRLLEKIFKKKETNEEAEASNENEEVIDNG